MSSHGNIIVGNIYRRPHSDARVFLRGINGILMKISHEKKIAYILEGFNLDLLKSDQEKSVYEIINVSY